jgi:hypothetical protein
MEWREVVDAWQLDTWPAYRDVPRLGRKTRLGEKQRVLLWSIMERVWSEIAARGLITVPSVFAREVERACAAVRAAGMNAAVLDGKSATEAGTVAVSTMHLAKGLEFRAVAVMACDDEVIPLQSRIENVVDDADLEDVYNTERHLLYVACTRARDHLLVSGVEPASEFLDDL